MTCLALPKYLTDLRLRAAVTHDGHRQQKLREANLSVAVDVIEFKYKVL